MGISVKPPYKIAPGNIEGQAYILLARPKDMGWGKAEVRLRATLNELGVEGMRFVILKKIKTVVVTLEDAQGPDPYLRSQDYDEEIIREGRSIILASGEKCKSVMRDICRRFDDSDNYDSKVYLVQKNGEKITIEGVV